MINIFFFVQKENISPIYICKKGNSDFRERGYDLRSTPLSSADNTHRFPLVTDCHRITAPPLFHGAKKIPESEDSGS